MMVYKRPASFRELNQAVQYYWTNESSPIFKLFVGEMNFEKIAMHDGSGEGDMNVSVPTIHHTLQSM